MAFEPKTSHGQASPFANRSYAGFHQEVIEQLAPEGIARLYLLAFDGRPVAFQYGFLYREKYYDFQNGFDARIREHSPGDVLLQLILNDLIRQKVKEFDFLRGDESYKAFFADQQRRTESTLVCRRPGAAYLGEWLRTRIASAVRPVP